MTKTLKHLLRNRAPGTYALSNRLIVNTLYNLGAVFTSHQAYVNNTGTYNRLEVTYEEEAQEVIDALFETVHKMFRTEIIKPTSCLYH